jgi:hypothetical protein
MGDEAASAVASWTGCAECLFSVVAATGRSINTAAAAPIISRAWGMRSNRMMISPFCSGKADGEPKSIRHFWRVEDSVNCST